MLRCKRWGEMENRRRLQLQDFSETIVLHTRRVLTCWQPWWGLGTDITHLLHMWADTHTPNTQSLQHMCISLCLCLPHICKHCWEQRGRVEIQMMKIPTNQTENNNAWEEWMKQVSVKHPHNVSVLVESKVKVYKWYRTFLLDLKKDYYFKEMHCFYTSLVLCITTSHSSRITHCWFWWKTIRKRIYINQWNIIK